MFTVILQTAKLNETVQHPIKKLKEMLENGNTITKKHPQISVILVYVDILDPK